MKPEDVNNRAAFLMIQNRAINMPPNSEDALALGRELVAAAVNAAGAVVLTEEERAAIKSAASDLAEMDPHSYHTVTGNYVTLRNLLARTEPAAAEDDHE